jgi:hypothetical protein
VADLPIGGPIDTTSSARSPYGAGIGRARLHNAGIDTRPEVQEFLRISRHRWLTSKQATDTNRESMRQEQRFAAGGMAQWDSVDVQVRRDDARPCLTVNRIPQFIRQVSNQSRMNRSQILVSPRGGSASVKVANAFQGVIRSIEIDSDADVAYDTAGEHQLRTGLGLVRLKAEYDGHDSFQQVCRIRRLRNPLSAYWDPSGEDADWYDKRWMHIIGVIGKDEYEARWGFMSSYGSLVEYMRHNEGAADWMPEGKIVLAEYYYVVMEKRTLLELADGTTLFEGPALANFAEAWQDEYPGIPVPEVTKSRSVEVRVPYWCLHNAVAILEGNTEKTAGRRLPGTRIPIFPLIGDELDLDGQVDYRGMVRDSIGPQQMYNFWTSSIAETIALAPKAPWIAAAGQIDEYLSDWKVANKKALSVLLYDPKTVDGQIVPPPQRNVANPPIEGMVMGLKESDQDIKAVMGLFEASLGEKGPQQSGKAITAVQQQGLLANSNYLDNLQRLKRSLGRALTEWVPVIYDEARVMHLVQPDGKRKQAIVHSGQQFAPEPGDFDDDITEIYDLGGGQFEITISTGPGYQAERQQTEAWLLELFKVLPQLGAIGADIVLENSDNPAAQQLAKRAKLMLPQQLQDENDPESQLPRLTAQNAQLHDLLQKADGLIKQLLQKVQGQELQAHTKVQVAVIQAQAAMAMAAAKSQDAAAMKIFDTEYQRLAAMTEHLSDMALQDAAHDHALEQQTQQAALQPPPEPAQSGGGQ